MLIIKLHVNILFFLMWRIKKKSVPQVCMTVRQEQIMPSSLIYSILETSSPSRMAPSPELALVAWKPRSGGRYENINTVGWMRRSWHWLCRLVWLRWKQLFGRSRVGRLSSSPMARIPKSPAMSSQTSWKGRRLAPFSLKWNLQVQGAAACREHFPTCWMCVFMFDAFIYDASRSYCGAADRDGSACRQDSGLPATRTGQSLTPSLWPMYSSVTGWVY